MDAKVSEFLKDFIIDLEAYVKAKEKYLDATHELKKLDSPEKYNLAKTKLTLKKSTSFRNKSGDSKTLLTPSKPKSDDSGSGSGSATSKKKESPTLEKRKLWPNINNIPPELTMSSPAVGKKGFLSQFQTVGEAGNGSMLQMLASPSMKSMNKNLLQTNVNHIAGLSNFAGARKATEEVNGGLRDKFKIVINTSNIMENKSALGQMETGIMSPSMSMLAQKEQQKKQRGRITIHNPPSLFGKKANDGKVPEELPKSPPKRNNSQSKVANSGMQWFKSIREEDTGKLTSFAPPPT